MGKRISYVLATFKIKEVYRSKLFTYILRISQWINEV